MTEARIGHGSTFARGDGASPEVFTAIAEVVRITPPQLSRDVVDATHMLSTGGWREHIGGLKDGGECTIEMNFLPGNATQQALIEDQISDDAGNYRITFPDATTWTFVAFCTGFQPDDPLDDKMTATATFKLTGQPAFVVP